MPEMMRKIAPEPKKSQVMFADDDLLPNDMPVDELPRDLPTGNTALAKGHKRYQSPMAKVNSGDVPINTPAGAANKSVSMGRMSQNLLASMGDQGEDEGYSEEETPVPPIEETLPAIIQTALSTTPGEVKSYQMKNILRPNPNKGKLEKMMHDQFSMFSENPLGVSAKDIYSISSWTNSKYEIQAMAAWVYMHGDRIADNITTNVNAMPGYLPKASLWEDHETETRFLIVRELPADLAGENTESVDETLEQDEPNIAENLQGQKPSEDQCLYYIYAWHEAKNHIAANEVKKQLEAVALDLVKCYPGQTVQEAYKELLWDYLQEGAEKVKGGYENIGKTGKKHSKKPMTKKRARKQQKAMFANGYHEAVDPLRNLIPMLKKTWQLLAVPTREFTQAQDFELSDLMDQIVPLIPRALRVALRNAGLGGRGAKGFIEEFSDPDVNDPGDWEKLLTDKKFLTKQFMDFKNDTSWMGEATKKVKTLEQRAEDAVWNELEYVEWKKGMPDFIVQKRLGIPKKDPRYLPLIQHIERFCAEHEIAEPTEEEDAQEAEFLRKRFPAKSGWE